MTADRPARQRCRAPFPAARAAGKGATLRGPSRVAALEQVVDAALAAPQVVLPVASGAGST
jgi:hypothetical protein